MILIEVKVKISEFEMGMRRNEKKERRKIRR
jgi:hypothetical protein